MKLIRSLLKHFTGGGKALIRKKSILISSLAVLVLTAAVGAGVVLHTGHASAKLMKVKGENDITWAYTIDTSLNNSPAEEVYIDYTETSAATSPYPNLFPIPTAPTSLLLSAWRISLTEIRFFSILPSAHSLTLTLTTVPASSASTTSSVTAIPASTILNSR